MQRLVALFDVTVEEVTFSRFERAISCTLQVPIVAIGYDMKVGRSHVYKIQEVSFVDSLVPTSVGEKSTKVVS